jgi:hypothetical protein
MQGFFYPVMSSSMKQTIIKFIHNQFVALYINGII